MELLITIFRYMNLWLYLSAICVLVMSFNGIETTTWSKHVLLAYIVLGYPFVKAMFDVTEAIGCQGKGRGR
jgi:hypothetical protein